MARIETVNIVREGSRTGYKTINKSDFDADAMELFEGEAVSGEETPDEAFAVAIANVNSMKKDDLVVALEAMKADTTGNVPVLKVRLQEVMTTAYNNGGSE